MSDSYGGLSQHAVGTVLRHLQGVHYDKSDVAQFLGFASVHVSRSQSQLFQDLWALWESGGKSGGYFVEFGAADGIHFSNTLFLEREMGWSGIVSEPHPLFRDELQRNRDCYVSTDCVWSSSGETLSFLASDNRLLARVAELAPDDCHESAGSRAGHEVDVSTISLNDLLAEANAPTRIDYLSVDTEGSEFEILKCFDFNQWDVRTITVEHNYTPLRDELHALLSSKGYERKWPDLSQFDDWYVRQS